MLESFLSTFIAKPKRFIQVHNSAKKVFEIFDDVSYFLHGSASNVAVLLRKRADWCCSIAKSSAFYTKGRSSMLCEQNIQCLSKNKLVSFESLWGIKRDGCGGLLISSH
jgi:hypothetical protein